MGSGAFGPLQRLLTPEALDFVALSHLHPDHCADMTGLHVYAKYRPGTALGDLEVYGPAGTDQQLAAIQYSLDPAQPRVFPAQTWQANRPVQVGPMTITPHLMRHPVETWGFSVAGPSSVGSGQRKLAYSADTDLCDGLDELAAGADLLLVEAAFQEGRDASRGVHLTGKRAGQAAAKACANRVVVTHIPPWYDADETMSEVAREYAGAIHQAKSNHYYVI